jgi:hypothetical protein
MLRAVLMSGRIFYCTNCHALPLNKKNYVLFFIKAHQLLSEGSRLLVNSTVPSPLTGSDEA